MSTIPRPRSSMGTIPARKSVGALSLSSKENIATMDIASIRQEKAAAPSTPVHSSSNDQHSQSISAADAAKRRKSEAVLHPALSFSELKSKCEVLTAENVRIKDEMEEMRKAHAEEMRRLCADAESAHSETERVKAQAERDRQKYSEEKEQLLKREQSALERENDINSQHRKLQGRCQALEKKLVEMGVDPITLSSLELSTEARNAITGRRHEIERRISSFSESLKKTKMEINHDHQVAVEVSEAARAMIMSPALHSHSNSSTMDQSLRKAKEFAQFASSLHKPVPSSPSSSSWSFAPSSSKQRCADEFNSSFERLEAELAAQMEEEEHQIASIVPPRKIRLSSNSQQKLNAFTSGFVCDAMERALNEVSSQEQGFATPTKQPRLEQEDEEMLSPEDPTIHSKLDWKSALDYLKLDIEPIELDRDDDYRWEIDNSSQEETPSFYDPSVFEQHNEDELEVERY